MPLPRQGRALHNTEPMTTLKFTRTILAFLQGNAVKTNDVDSGIVSREAPLRLPVRIQSNLNFYRFI